MYLVRQTGPLPKMCLFCKPNYTRSYEDGRRVFDIPLTNVYGPHFYFSWLVQTCDIPPPPSSPVPVRWVLGVSSSP